MEVEQRRKCGDTLTTGSWGFRHTFIHDGGVFKLVLNLCRNGGRRFRGVQTCRASQV